jgi:HlyD family secretion protein
LKAKNYGRPLAALVCGLCALLLGSCGNGGASDYQTVNPERGVVENIVEDTGTVAYRDPYSVIPVVNGKILSCMFEEGDTVKAGQELYVIDSTALEDQIAQAELSLESATASREQSERACYDLSVRSSAAGTITAVYCHVGDYVGIGTRVADVMDTSNLTLTVPFSTEAVATIAPGSAATITFQSYSDQLSGTVKRIYDSATALPGGAQGVYVEISFSNPGALTSGIAAMASIGDAACMDVGTVAYATEQSIYAAQSGKVQTLYIQEGNTVSQGQTVLSIENVSLTNAATSAALSEKTASVNLEQLKAKRADYTITAPVAGTIITRYQKLGDYAAAATPMATLAREDDMCVKVAIDEIYIDRIWSGQEAEVTFTTDSGERRTYPAEVYRVDDTGTTSGGVTDYTVELALEDMEGLKSGMNVSVSIFTQRSEDCLRIPSGAVSGGAVQVLERGKSVERQVTTGATGGGYTEILEGLSESDVVILS